VTGTAAASGSATFTLTGGLGADKFVITSGSGATVVTITDFKAGEGDNLVTGIDYDTKVVADAEGDNLLQKALAGNSLTAVLEAAYKFDGVAAFEFGGNTYLVSADDKDGLSDGDYIVILTGVTGLSSFDFTANAEMG
jgi:hypothetical protein